METYGINFREIKDAQDFLTAINILKSEFELLVEKSKKNIETNNMVISEMDKAESMALSISRAFETHNQIIEKIDKTIRDVDQLPLEFKRQSKEALSSIDLQLIKEKIEMLLKEELLRLDNSVSLLARINDTFAKSLDYNYKTVREINEKTNEDLIEFKKAAKSMANRSILHFVYGFGFCSVLSIVLYFSVLK